MTHPDVVAVPNDPVATNESDSTGPLPLAWVPPVPQTITRERRSVRLLPRTLTARLVSGVVLLVLVVVTVSGIATYTLLRPFLVQRLDQQLSPIASGNATNITRCIYNYSVANCRLGGDLSQGAVASTVSEWFVTYTSDGQPIITVSPGIGHLRPLDLSNADIAQVIANPSKPRTVTTTEGESVRVSGRVIATPVGSLVAVTGLSTDETAHTLARLLLLEFAVGAATVALAAALTAWGVRVGLRPLYRVTRTAQEVTAELGPDGAGLERRVADADPSTEVGQVAASMNTLLGAVQNEFAARVRSEDRMRQFLADASHELRTPLTSIRGYAELSRLQGQSTSAPDDPIRRIEVEGTRMSRLVEDLLVLARGDDKDGERSDEPVDVDGLITDAARTVEAAHPDRELSVGPSGGARVLGDRDQLLRLLVNLLNNAAVHTAPGGPIRVEAVPEPSGAAEARVAGPSVTLRVSDTGPGLPPEDAAHVFERFWRADKARSRSKGGSGLGMAIVAQIADAHGGSVRFDSDVERGTVVSVTLPMLAGAPGHGSHQGTGA